ncbi:hypothetical protein FH972_025330 [Carpinus fangiana]|uniref:Uncharacterized protein n=1 Tax=Carpinus fangiana TaxID=176857 RepID=A0A5N6L0Y5_9ROSI|nr:hypothetical protein FH972_025330 [Carpinus fangiana]
MEIHSLTSKPIFGKGRGISFTKKSIKGLRQTSKGGRRSASILTIRKRSKSGQTELVEQQEENRSNLREHPPVKPFLDLSQQAMVDGSSKRASEGWPAQEKAEG